jgi:serine/threonine protein kinase
LARGVHSSVRIIDPKLISSGEIVGRRYRATRRIASGAMGEVWEAVHAKLGHRVALKVLRKETHTSPEILKRFTREAFLLARVESDHVVRVVDFIERGKHGPVLVMEMIEGESLAEVVNRGDLSVEESVDVAIDVLRGLAAIHAKNVIHRDVKPGNIMLRNVGDGKRRAVLVDFGVGRLLDETIADDGEVSFPACGDEVTTADRVVGTVEYMAPEQIMSCQTAETSVDVYAVGAVIYRSVTGHHPFNVHGADLLRRKIDCAAPPMRLERTDPIARELVAIVSRAMAIEPSARFASASELLGALLKLRNKIELARIVEIAEADVRPVPEPPRLPRAHRSRRTLAIVVAAVFAAAFAACSTDMNTPSAQEAGAPVTSSP